MKARRRLLVVTSVVAAIGGIVWIAAAAEPAAPVESVDVIVEADENVCWTASTGNRDPYDMTEDLPRCGSGAVGFSDDYVAFPSSVVVRKTQGNDAKIAASFQLNGTITETESTDDPYGTIVVSGN